MANHVDYLWHNYDASYQRDQRMRDSQLAMGQPAPHGRFVHVYLNGLYWGIYNLTVRPNESFAAAYLGGKKSEYDVIAEYNGELRAGTREAWDRLLALADRVPLEPAAYWQMQGLNPDVTRNPSYPILLNLDNLIDYMALHIYAPAIDWPNRNWWAARRRGPESTGFHFFTWDQEVAAKQARACGLQLLARWRGGGIFARGAALQYAGGRKGRLICLSLTRGLKGLGILHRQVKDGLVGQRSGIPAQRARRPIAQGLTVCLPCRTL
jgi:hypothetical protein